MRSYRYSTMPSNIICHLFLILYIQKTAQKNLPLLWNTCLHLAYILKAVVQMRFYIHYRLLSYIQKLCCI
nr:MAG TPA: hypothetical protein [Caudoviricetes sp.]